MLLPQTSTNQLDGAKLARIVGHAGEQTGAVYEITIGLDDLHMAEMGAPINARMSLNTWAAFTGPNEKAALGTGPAETLASGFTAALNELGKHGAAAPSSK